jgi:hypothetical protein
MQVKGAIIHAPHCHFSSSNGESALNAVTLRADKGGLLVD